MKCSIESSIIIIRPDAAQAIHAVLAAAEQISDIRWHFEADLQAGDEERGQPEPTAG